MAASALGSMREHFQMVLCTVVISMLSYCSLDIANIPGCHQGWIQYSHKTTPCAKSLSIPKVPVQKIITLGILLYSMT